MQYRRRLCIKSGNIYKWITKFNKMNNHVRAFEVKTSKIWKFSRGNQKMVRKTMKYYWEKNLKKEWIYKVFRVSYNQRGLTFHDVCIRNEWFPASRLCREFKKIQSEIMHVSHVRNAHSVNNLCIVSAGVKGLISYRILCSVSNFTKLLTKK